MRKLPDYGDYSGGVADGDREDEEERGSESGNGGGKAESDDIDPPHADGRMGMESDDGRQGHSSFGRRYSRGHNSGQSTGTVCIGSEKHSQNLHPVLKGTEYRQSI